MAGTTSTTSTPAEVETPATEVEQQVFVLDATKLDADIAAAYDELLPFLRLGKRTSRKLNVEVRTLPEPRMRMACSWGRKSYFAVIGEVAEDGTPSIPAQVKAAILRQVDREYGRAIREIKGAGDEKVTKRLEKLLADRKAAGKGTPEEAPAETAEAPASA